MSQIYQIKTLINHVKYTPMMEYDSVQRRAYMQITFHGQTVDTNPNKQLFWSHAKCAFHSDIYENSIKINEPLQLILVLGDVDFISRSSYEWK